MAQNPPPPQTDPSLSDTVCVGIDWADQLHAFHVAGPDGRPVAGSDRQDPAQIREVIDICRQKYPGCRFAVAVEQSQGPLINALLAYEDVLIYPVNPAAMASYRKAFAHGGGKNDPVDAKLLCQYLQHYRDQFRPLRSDKPLTIELRSLARDRRRLVDERVAHINELKAVLKLYFPVVLELGAAKLYADFLIRFLMKYACLKSAQNAGPTKLRKFFFRVGAARNAQRRIDLILNAVPLTEDEVTIRCCARRMTAIVHVISTLNAQIDS
jgi:hypothetical protein